MWWHAPVTPAAPEAEAGESLEPGRRRLQSALGDRVRLCQKKEKKGRIKIESKKREKVKGRGEGGRKTVRFWKL